MSKAEKFISDCTRNCSNELDSFQTKTGAWVDTYHPWLTPDQAREAVKIARKEIYERLAAHYRDYMHNPTGKQLEAFFGMDMITDLKQAEKDLLANKHEKSWRLDEKLWKGIKDTEEASYQYTYDASNDWAYDVPTWDDVQDAFKAGSEWKEDIALTWKDIRELYVIFAEVDTEIELCKTDIKAETLGYYQEVLKRFKDFKEREEL